MAQFLRYAPIRSPAPPFPVTGPAPPAHPSSPNRSDRSPPPIPRTSWIWRSAGEVVTFRGSHGFGQMLVFRTMVPAPGAMALLGLGGLLTVRC